MTKEEAQEILNKRGLDSSPILHQTVQTVSRGDSVIRDLMVSVYEMGVAEGIRRAGLSMDYILEAKMKQVEPAPGVDARTDDGRFISGTGYGGERR